MQVDKITFSYNQNKVIKEITMSVDKGDFVGVIGPNASGKSTLIKNLARTLQPIKGVVYLSNQLLNKYSAQELAKKMAVVPQNTNIDFSFNVYDIIMMGRTPYQKRWSKLKQSDRKIVKQVMELTDTYKLKDKIINQLSGGEKQRVIIARALAQQPEILILDEPTASLDINYQAEIYDILEYLNLKLGLTIITVSHNLNLTAQYCQKIFLINSGQIYAEGTAVEVLTAKNIAQVYQAEVQVKKNKLTQKPIITLLPQNKLVDNVNAKSKDFKIHVIAGGGTAVDMLQQLSSLNYNLSAGVLNSGDADWQIAVELGIEVVTADPFAAIKAEEVMAHKKLINQSDLIILTEVPFGYGNLANLTILQDFPTKNKIFLAGQNIKKRDYVKGKAESIWNKLIDGDNLRLITDQSQVLKEIKKFERLKMER